MFPSDETAAMVALLHDGPYAGRQMQFRQQLVTGMTPTEIARADGVTAESVEHAACLVEGWRAAGERILTWMDDDYPRQLRDVRDFPPVIFVRGCVRKEDLGVGVVGSRAAGPGALRAAAEMATLLAARGVTVVSGLAKGVDAAAHQAALRVGGRTVAVIGNGIDRYYPAVNRVLQQQIEAQGLVLSQFWPGTPGARHTFPMRNAVLSAYAQATVIVAAEETSGTRHLASQAIAHGRPLVLSASVATNTSWGKSYADDPHALVRVAHSAEDAVQRALHLCESSWKV